MLSEIPVGVEPEGIGVSHDGKWAVNTSETTNMAHFIDTDTHEITDNVLVDQRPRFAEWTSDDAEVWVSAEIGGTVSVIDNATRQIKHKITFEIPGVPKEAIQPVGVRVSKDRKRAFVALGPSNRVAVVNAQTFEVEKYLLVGQRVWQLAFSPDEKFIYSTNGVSNDISVIDVENLEVDQVRHRRRLPVGRGGPGLSGIGQRPIPSEREQHQDETYNGNRRHGCRARRGVNGTAHAQAGLLGGRTDLEPITLASGKPLAEAPYELDCRQILPHRHPVRRLGRACGRRPRVLPQHVGERGRDQ